MSLKRFAVFISIIAFLFLLSYFYPKIIGHLIEFEREEAVLSRVIDGDTVEILHDEKNEKVRLLGINSPEKNMPFFNNALSYLKQFENQTIMLEADKEDTDKYGRKLRYIFYKDIFINKEILKEGLANAYMHSGLRYETELLNAEEQAKKSGKGIWGKSYEVCARCVTLNELNYKEEYFILANSCSFTCVLKDWFVKDSGKNTFYLQPIKPNQEIRINSTKEVWNEHDKFFLFDSKGLLVIYYEY